MASKPPVPEVDVVFLRNVLSGFDGAARGRVLDRMYDTLRPGGVLVLGETESDAYDVPRCWEMERSGRSVWWRKPAGAAARV